MLSRFTGAALGGRGVPNGTLVAAFALDLLTGLIILAYGNSYLVRTLHAHASYPAFALAVYGLVKLLSASPSGWLADHTHVRQATLVAAALQGAGLFVMLLTRSGEGYIAGVAPMSAGTTLAWLLVFRSLGATVAPAGRSAATAYMTLVATAGLGAGFGVAALIAEIDEPRAAFGVALAVVVIYAAALMRVARDAPHVRDEPDANALPHHATRAEAITSALTFAHGLAFASIAAAVGPFALRWLGLTLLRTGMAGAPAGVASVLALLVMGHRSHHGRRLRELTPLYALGAVACFVMAPTTSPLWFMLWLVPLGMAIGGASPLWSATRIDVAHAGDAPGAVLGRLAIAEGLGGGVGPFLVGLAIEAGGEQAGIVALGVALTLAAIVAAAGARLVRL